MTTPDLTPETSAAWRKLWELIASRVIEHQSPVQEAQPVKEKGKQRYGRVYKNKKS